MGELRREEEEARPPIWGKGVNFEGKSNNVRHGPSSSQRQRVGSSSSWMKVLMEAKKKCKARMRVQNATQAVLHFTSSKIAAIWGDDRLRPTL